MNLKTAILYINIIALSLIFPHTDSAPLMLPLTIGGFSGDTMIDKMMVTPEMKFFIAAYSWDS